jgi:FKBP-type peptidyl-prolyl cis-trans isomerase 2
MSNVNHPLAGQSLALGSKLDELLLAQSKVMQTIDRLVNH